MNVFHKTLGGLNKSYYIRHFIFGLIMSAIFFSLVRTTASGITFGALIFIIINTILYPYSRFVYESVMKFILGENVFFVNAKVMLFYKSVTMMVCWGGSIFIAPIGLAYLYYHHSKVANQS